jgi:hypothetical protein
MKKCFILFIAAFFICGCGSSSYTFVPCDILYINNSTYITCEISIIDNGVVGKIFSKVRDKIADNNNVAGYKFQNGDSLNLKAGTPIYEVQGFDTLTLAAVKDNKGSYVAYINEEKKDQVYKELKNEIAKAASVRVTRLDPEGLSIVKYVDDYGTLNKIKEIITHEDEFECDSLDEYNKFYNIEFLCLSDDGYYRPCLRFLYRFGNPEEPGILMDSGIKKIDKDLNILLETIILN